MPRNFFRRVEVCFPVFDPKLKKRVIAEGLTAVSRGQHARRGRWLEDGIYRQLGAGRRRSRSSAQQSAARSCSRARAAAEAR